MESECEKILGTLQTSKLGLGYLNRKMTRSIWRNKFFGRTINEFKIFIVTQSNFPPLYLPVSWINLLKMFLVFEKILEEEI